MDKKNTLLLTVIAIATLLVAVVGATFAYFTAQQGEGQNAEVNVKTSTVDTLTFNTKPIYIFANQQNFANTSGAQTTDKIGSQKAISTSTVEYQKGGDGSTDYCYTATVKITKNNFKYAPEETDFKEDQDGRNHASFKNGHAPELLLKISKSETVTGTSASGPTLTEYNQDLTNAKYVSLQTDRRVCTQTNNEEVSSESGIQYEGNCEDAQPVAGFDVTTLANDTTIPTEASGEVLKHKLSATSEKDKVVDTWTAELVFVNYDWDQQYNASTPEETKQFSASFEFKKVDCGGD